MFHLANPCGRLAAIAALSIGLCAPALAALIEGADILTTAPQSTQRPVDALDFLTRVSETGLAARVTGHDRAFGEYDRPAFALGVGQLISPPARLRGDVDLFLWNLLSIVHAQRGGRPFELTDSSVAFVLTHHADPPAAVPLPPAMWLFVMGLLGLAGTRMTGHREGSRGREGTRLPPTAVPA